MADYGLGYQNLEPHGRILRMRTPSKRFGSILVGVVVQVPATLMLLGQVFDMHNRFSALLSIVLPYAAIADRLNHPPFALMSVVVIVTLVQYPLYGAVIGQLWMKVRLTLALAAIVSIHAVASSLAIYMKIAKV
jgi:hypothetical protein